MLHFLIMEKMEDQISQSILYQKIIKIILDIQLLHFIIIYHQMHFLLKHQELMVNVLQMKKVKYHVKDHYIMVQHINLELLILVVHINLLLVFNYINPHILHYNYHIHIWDQVELIIILKTFILEFHYKMDKFVNGHLLYLILN